MRPSTSKPVAWLVVVGLALSALCLVLFTRDRSQTPSPGLRAPPMEGAVALVNGQPIPLAVWQQHATRRGPDGARAALDDLIRQELLFQRACAAGYDRDPQLLGSFRRMVAARFEEDRLGQRGAPAATAEEARAYYNTNLNQYRMPEKRRAAVVFVRVPHTASAERKAEFADQVNAIREEAFVSRQTERHFGALAVRYSDDQATRYAGGDLGWLSRAEAAPRFGKALNEALFALTNATDLSPVFEVPGGLCFIKLIELQPASTRRFEEVREALAYQLTQQRRQQERLEFDQQLRAGAQIQINDDAVTAATVAAKGTEPKPPRMPSL